MENTVTSKTCSKCGKRKDTSEFYMYKKTGNLWAYCRSCHYTLYTKANKKKWDKKNPDKKRAHDRRSTEKWIKNNPERWAEIQARAYQKFKRKKQMEKT